MRKIVLCIMMLGWVACTHLNIQELQEQRVVAVSGTPAGTLYRSSLLWMVHYLPPNVGAAQRNFLFRYDAGYSAALDIPLQYKNFHDDGYSWLTVRTVIETRDGRARLTLIPILGSPLEEEYHNASRAVEGLGNSFEEYIRQQEW